MYCSDSLGGDQLVTAGGGGGGLIGIFQHYARRSVKARISAFSTATSASSSSALCTTHTGNHTNQSIDHKSSP